MIRRILSVIVALAMCATMPLVAKSFEQKSQTTDSSASNAQTESSALDAVTNQIVEKASDSGINLNSEYVYTMTVDPEWTEWLCGTPEEVLSGSTEKLLDYFLDSSFLWMEAYSSSDTVWDSESQTDYSCHAAFQELIERDDFLEALEACATRIQSETDADQPSFELRLKKLLAQPLVEALVTEANAASCSLPNLEAFYTEIVTEATQADALATTASTITYNQSGTIKGTSKNHRLTP